LLLLLLLLLLLVLLLLLLLLVLLALALCDLLVAPGALVHWLLLGQAGHLRRLHEQSGASVSNGLDQGEVSAPLFDTASLDVHGLLIHVVEGHELTLLHLHVKVNARRHHWEVLWQDNLQRVPR